MDYALVVMAKEPIVGLVKTRMCPPLSEKAAAKLYKALLLDTLELVKSVDNSHRIIAFSPGATEDSMRKIVGAEFELKAQRGNDLGERLSNLFQDLLGAYSKVVVLGSDSPTLPPEVLQEAFTRLDSCEIVLGPCLDGGYYLVGAKTPQIKEVFKDIAWGTDVVLKQTIDRARSQGLNIFCLKMWYDIDTWADVEQLMRELKDNGGASPFLARWTKKFLRKYMAD